MCSPVTPRAVTRPGLALRIDRSAYAVTHDQLFKEIAIAFPGDLVTLTLPHLAYQVDLSALDFQPNRERFDKILPGRRWLPDLVSDVRGRSGSEAPALAHIEIEYAYRRKRVGILGTYNRVLAEATGLAVHTAVIYLHGGPPGLVERVEKSESYGRVLRNFRYNSLGLAKASGWRYLQGPVPLGWAFAVLMSPKGFASRGELAIACVRRILADRELDRDRRAHLLNFVQTYVKLDERTAPEFRALLRESKNQEIREMFMTWRDEVKAEGRQEGKAEGTEKMRDVVFQLVTQRFGDLSESTRRAIFAITSLDELAELAKRVLLVESLEELRIGRSADRRPR